MFSWNKKYYEKLCSCCLKNKSNERNKEKGGKESSRSGRPATPRSDGPRTSTPRAMSDSGSANFAEP